MVRANRLIVASLLTATRELSGVTFVSNPTPTYRLYGTTTVLDSVLWCSLLSRRWLPEVAIQLLLVVSVTELPTARESMYVDEEANWIPLCASSP
jgi:hypothetical protein